MRPDVKKLVLSLLPYVFLAWLFGKAAENVIVTPEHFMLVAIVGGILLVAAVLVSSISTMRLKPKQILAQME